ncbi:RNI-like protein [Roridomyces roridus]|uniref:RNI-like protein n=1 Tax=Roridomyces roridus TaxID=1738132 RepID=A0AAD7BTW5_9AGAR|nr:RNI-like protein [Roridomyces roridus]
MSRPRKKARLEFGAPTADDSPSTSSRDSSSALSARRRRYSTVPSLVSLCSRVFADHYVRLRNKESLWKRISIHLQSMPEPLLPKLLAELTRTCPTYLTHEFIVTYFFRGDTIVLTSDLPGVKPHTIRALDRFSGLRDVEMSGFDKIPDTAFAAVLPRFTVLKRLVLRGCSLVGQKTLAAIARSCEQLEVLNLNYTATTPQALQPVLLACQKLEVLKLAGLQNWTDAAFAKLLTRDLSLPHLRNLKFSRLAISEASLNLFLPLCPELRRLDISFTGIRHPLLGAYPAPPLEKLSLTSTSTSNADLLTLLPRLPTLGTLAIGALGASARSIAAIDSSMTLNDTALLKILPALQAFDSLNSLSLVGNIKLGSALAPFIATVGRSCKWLNLSGLPALRSPHLAGLVSVDGAPPARLETLLLNNTGIDDDAAPFLAACPALAWLEVGDTKMTSEGLFLVLDGCPQLATLGLKSCRGVRVGDRRRFFEAWEEDRAGG